MELTKPVLNSDDVPEERKAEVRRVLLAVMESALRLAPPDYAVLDRRKFGKTLAPMLGYFRAIPSCWQNYPVPAADKMNLQAEADMQWFTRFNWCGA